jgi:hypothetical protein
MVGRVSNMGTILKEKAATGFLGLYSEIGASEVPRPQGRFD